MSENDDVRLDSTEPLSVGESSAPIEGQSASLDHFRWAAWDASFDPLVVLQTVRDDEGVIVDFEYIDANSAALEYNQTTREKLIGARILDIFPAHRSTTLFASYTHTIETGEPLVLDDYVYPNEVLAEERRYDIRGVKVDDALVYSWRDVTERYAEERRFKMLAENASDIVYEIDAEGIIKWISPSVKRLLGWEPSSMIGTPSSDIMWLDDISIALTARTAVLRGEPQKSFEIRYVDVSGMPHWMRWTGRAVRGHSGSIVALVVGLTQIDVEVETRASLSAAQAVFRTLAEYSKDVIIRIDAQGKVDWISPSVDVVLGYRPQSLLGTFVKDLFHQSSSANVDAWEAVVRTGDRLDNVEVTIRHSNGDALWMKMTVHPNPLLDGVFNGGLMTLSNVHEAVILRRAASTLTAGAQALVKADSEGSLLRAMCDAALLQGGYEFSWYGRKVMNEDRTVDPVCVSKRHSDYLEGRTISWAEGIFGYGPTGQAIRKGRPVVVQDFQSDSTLEPWKDAAREHNFNSVISLPVRVQGVIDGAWQIYASERDAFSEQAVEVLKELASEMGYGLTRLRERERMLRSINDQSMLATAIEQLDEEILVTDLEGSITFVNPALCKSSGYSEEEILGSNPRMFQSGLHTRDFYEHMWAELVAGRTWQGVLMNRRKNGRVHLEETVITPIRGEDGVVNGYVGVKHDPINTSRDGAKWEMLARDVADISRIERDWRQEVSLHAAVEKLCRLATTLDNIDAACLLERGVEGMCKVLGSHGTEMFTPHGDNMISVEEALHTVPSRYSPVMVDMSPAAWPTTSSCFDVAKEEGLQSIVLFPVTLAATHRGLLLLASKDPEETSKISERLATLNELAKLLSAFCEVHFQ